MGANPVGGLVGFANHSINDSAATVGGSISGGDYVGGLVGRGDSSASISNSHSSVSGNISGVSLLGGLAGFIDPSAPILNSHSSVSGNISGYSDIGGLVGSGASEINDSNAFVFGNVSGENYIGGLIGNTSANIVNSDVFIGGNLSATNYLLGGLVGSYSYNSITNSNSSVFGSFSGPFAITGVLIGSSYWGNITNSFYSINEVIGGTELSELVGEYYSDSLPTLVYTEGAVGDISDVPQFPAILEVINNVSAVYAIDECLNGPNPYLVSLLISYENSCLAEDPAPPQRERVVREVTQTRTSEKIEKTLGFKSDTPLPKDALVSFLQATDKIDIAKVKSLEITPTAIVRVIAKTGEALQISLKSESKDPMELWVLSPDGKWLFAGVITFGKDGKAILPPLQFKNAGDYSLALSTPSADSAKASAPLNLSGQVLVSVS
jgi:hypothetical protein